MTLICLQGREGLGILAVIWGEFMENGDRQKHQTHPRIREQLIDHKTNDRTGSFSS